MATLGAHYPTSGSNSMAANNGPSRLTMMQARLREQLMVEKESRLLEMAARQEAERNHTIQRVTRSSANSSLSSSLSSLNSSGGQGRVRKMFEERRSNGYNHSPVGWDKSYPLDPMRGGGGGGKPPVKPKGVIRNNRGVSVDRAYNNNEPATMKRSQSHATLQRNNNRNNNNDLRSPARGGGGLRPPQSRPPAHHKSTSSLLDANQNYNGRRSSGSSGGYSRGASRDTSPAPSPSPNGGSNRFGFRNNSNLSRGPSPSPMSNGGSPARSAPLPGPRRTLTTNRSYDEIDYGRSKQSEVRQPPPRRVSQPTRQLPQRQPPQQQARQYNSYEPEYDENTPPQRAPRQPQRNGSKSISGQSRGPPITLVKTNNNNDDYSPPVRPARKPKPAPKPLPKTSPAQSKLSANDSKPVAKAAPPPGTVSCKICERNFAKDRIEKHEQICAKSKAKSKKRKVFDPVKMRTSGTEAAKYVARGKHLEEKPKPKKVDWRKKHQDFIATVRAAKGVQGYEAPPVDTSDYEQCPHCGRKFSQGAAERHIPKCSSIQSNKPANRRR